MSFLIVGRTRLLPQLNRFVYRVAPAPRTSPDALDTVFSHKLQGQVSFTIAWPHHENPRGTVLPAPFCSFVGEVLREPAVKVRRPSNVEFSSMQGKNVRVHFFSPFTFGSEQTRPSRSVSSTGFLRPSSKRYWRQSLCPPLPHPSRDVPVWTSAFPRNLSRRFPLLLQLLVPSCLPILRRPLHLYARVPLRLSSEQTLVIFVLHARRRVGWR